MELFINIPEFRYLMSFIDGVSLREKRAIGRIRRVLMPLMAFVRMRRLSSELSLVDEDIYWAMELGRDHSRLAAHLAMLEKEHDAYRRIWTIYGPQDENSVFYR